MGYRSLGNRQLAYVGRRLAIVRQQGQIDCHWLRLRDEVRGQVRRQQRVALRFEGIQVHSI